MISKLNYHHLYYFYIVAREGSLARAAEILHVTPQTVSGQLSGFEDYLGAPLFDRKGRRLYLNALGQTTYKYAQQIFALGQELTSVLQEKDVGRLTRFTIGLTEVIPKILSFELLHPIMQEYDDTRFVFREGPLDNLLTELAVNKIDLLLTDRPLPPGTNVKAYNHFLGEDAISFYAAPGIARAEAAFPVSLHNAPLLLSGEQARSSANVLTWLGNMGVRPKVIAEFDDSALLKLFGQQGSGFFYTPSSIEAHVEAQYNVKCVGRTDEIGERYYAITPKRRITNPISEAIVELAKQTLEHEETSTA